ncbi:hypothetical protein BDN72DRAFT_906423 [Pluteus cervinus]|uniref:Uncharacterized protein n=1 Tax=Pluteus cervinus TaxID=181527 RepID=A0ACD2ZZD0_9AGAR|nr:hypothetical protein BDN72DRAFT_906423 [Pluteus cervinus]
MAALHESDLSPNSGFPNVQRDELQHHFEQVSSEAARLQVELAALTAQHAKFVKAALFYQAALAPWKQLPNEVLQRIFSFTKAEEPPTCVPFSKTTAPMQLTQVCSRWRGVALATPALWQDLKWVYLSHDKYAGKEILPFVQGWVS